MLRIQVGMRTQTRPEVAIQSNEDYQKRKIHKFCIAMTRVCVVYYIVNDNDTLNDIDWSIKIASSWNNTSWVKKVIMKGNDRCQIRKAMKIHHNVNIFTMGLIVYELSTRNWHHLDVAKEQKFLPQTNVQFDCLLFSLHINWLISCFSSLIWNVLLV